MRYLTVLLCIVAVFHIGKAISQSRQQEKDFVLKFNAEQVNAIFYVIDKSNAEHLTVQTVKDWFVKQIQPQVDTTAPKKK